MKLYLLIVISFFIIVSDLSGQDTTKAKAYKFLNGLFKNGRSFFHDSTTYRGYSKELKPLNTPLLNELLPDYRFYSTTFLSNYYEYFNVETALAFSKNRYKKSLFIHSPVFTYESPAFLNLFYGLKVSDITQGVTLANEIMSIFSDITYGGHFSRLINLKEKNDVSYELWHSDLSWRIYEFSFDDNYKLTQIKIKSGVKRQQMTDDYKRQ